MINSDDGHYKQQLLTFWSQNKVFAPSPGFIQSLLSKFGLSRKSKLYSSSKGNQDSLDILKYITETYDIKQIMEVGAWNTSFCEALAKITTGIKIACSDIPSPRWERISAACTTVETYSCNLIQAANLCISRPKSLIVALNVLGNVTPSDLSEFFYICYTHNILCYFKSGGLHSKSEEVTRKRTKHPGFDHNFRKVLEKNNLSVLYGNESPDPFIDGLSNYSQLVGNKTIHQEKSR